MGSIGVGQYGYNRCVIAHIRGQIVSKASNAVVIDCGGVGYELAISVATYTELREVGAEARLHVHTHVREDALLLFGFTELAEKRLFEKLLTISGVGPKLAITVLSGISAERLVGAIRTSDHATLTRIPGIGRKTAERVVLELKDKLEDMAGVAMTSAGSVAVSLGAVADDVLSALVNLGYARPVAQKAVETAAKDPAAAVDFERLFRAAMSAVR
jgi:Holliday junction DNA helicase RuvA